MSDPLTIFVDCMPKRLDGRFTESYAQWTVVYNLADRLFEFGPKGELVPGLAERCEISPDGRLYTLRLSRGRTFHTGEEVTATDVAFSLHLALRNRRPYSCLADVLRPEGIRAVGSHEVQLTLEKRYPTLLELFNFNENAIRSKRAHLRDKVVYSGPYRIENFDKDEVVLVQNQDHPSRSVGRFDTVRVCRLPATTRDSLDAPGPFVIMARSGASVTPSGQRAADLNRYLFMGGNSYLLLLKPNQPNAAYIKHVIGSFFGEPAHLAPFQHLRSDRSFYPRESPLFEPIATSPVARPFDRIPLTLRVTRQLLPDPLSRALLEFAAERGLDITLSESNEAYRPGHFPTDTSDAFIAACYLDGNDPVHIAKAYFAGHRSLVGGLIPQLETLLIDAGNSVARGERHSTLRRFYDLLFREPEATPLFFAPNALLYSHGVDVTALDYYANTIRFASFRRPIANASPPPIVTKDLGDRLQLDLSVDDARYQDAADQMLRDLIAAKTRRLGKHATQKALSESLQIPRSTLRRYIATKALSETDA